MAALIVAPTLYFLVPLMLPLDVIPQGLKDAVGPKLGDQRARGFIKLALQEFEGAMERPARSSRPPIRKRPSPRLLLPPTQKDAFHDPGLKPVNGGGLGPGSWEWRVRRPGLSPRRPFWLPGERVIAVIA